MICHRIVLRFVNLLAVAWLIVLGRGASLSAREWTDNTGMYHVEAEFVRLAGEKVHLRKPDGRVIAVVIARLDEEGQRAVAAEAKAHNSRSLAKIVNIQKQVISSRMSNQIALANAIWNEIGKLYQEQSAELSKWNARRWSLERSLGPAEAIQTVASGLAAHRPRAIWDALPHSYQQDVHSLLHEYAAQLDPELWQAGRQVLQKSILVLRKQQEFFLNYPLIREVLEESPGRLNETAALDSPEKTGKNTVAAWEATVQVLQLLLESDLADVSKLRTLDLALFLDQTGVGIMQQLALASRLTADDSFNESLALISGMKVSLESMVGTEAVVLLTSGQQHELNSMVLIEGKWLPAELAAAWPEFMSIAHAGLERLKDNSFAEAKPLLISQLQDADKMLDRLLTAESQEEFDALLGGLLVTESEQ